MRAAWLALLLLTMPALARDNGQWGDQPPEIRV